MEIILQKIPKTYPKSNCFNVRILLSEFWLIMQMLLPGFMAIYVFPWLNLRVFVSLVLFEKRKTKKINDLQACLRNASKVFVLSLWSRLIIFEPKNVFDRVCFDLTLYVEIYL